MRILSLDPSIKTVGWSTVDITDEEAEFKWGMWEVSGLSFQMRCADLRDYIEQEIGDFDELVLEWPMFYDNQRGHIASRRTDRFGHAGGDVINLAGIDMYIAGWFRVPHQQVHLYTAPDWKGQTDKDITGRRFFQQFGVNYLQVDNNVVDATMMLLHHCKKHNLVS